MSNFRAKPLEPKKITGQAWFDTNEGQKFIQDRMVTFCRSELVTQHIQNIHRNGITSATDSDIFQILMCKPAIFKEWLRNPDKPTEEQIWHVINTSWWTDAQKTTWMFIWEWENDDIRTDWLFGINDFKRMPMKYKEELKNKNMEYERALDHHAEQNREALNTR